MNSANIFLLEYVFIFNLRCVVFEIFDFKKFILNRMERQLLTLIFQIVISNEIIL